MGWRFAPAILDWQSAGSPAARVNKLLPARDFPHHLYGCALAMPTSHPQSKIQNRRREAPAHENPKSVGLSVCGIGSSQKWDAPPAAARLPVYTSSVTTTGSCASRQGDLLVLLARVADRHASQVHQSLAQSG
jgi:hypothetical protein